MGEVIDTVWVIVLPRNRGIVFDTISPSPIESWRKLIDNELLGTGNTRRFAHKVGYRARKVQVVLANRPTNKIIDIKPPS